MISSNPVADPSNDKGLVESAFDWWCRSKFQQRQQENLAGSFNRNDTTSVPLKDSCSAAWAFVRPITGDSDRTTGIAILDAVLQRFWGHQQGDASTAATSTFVATSFTEITFTKESSEPTPAWNRNGIGHSRSFRLPVVDIRGDSFTGKTSFLLSLAARFAFATRASRFPMEVTSGDDTNMNTNAPAVKAACSTGKEQTCCCSHCNVETEGSHLDRLQPHIILLDSCHQATVLKLASLVRTLIDTELSESSRTSCGSFEEKDIPDGRHRSVVESDMENCLERIHVATVDDLAGWAPLLETIRYHLVEKQAKDPWMTTPTLILWDGFLSEPQRQLDSVRVEVIRQVERLLQECGSFVWLVVSTTTTDHRHFSQDWDRLVTSRIQLKCCISTSNMKTAANPGAMSQALPRYVATSHGTQFPFSITSSGVLF